MRIWTKLSPHLGGIGYYPIEIGKIMINDVETLYSFIKKKNQ